MQRSGGGRRLIAGVCEALPVTIRNVQPIIEAKNLSKIYRAGKVEVTALPTSRLGAAGGVRQHRRAFRQRQVDALLYSWRAHARDFRQAC